MDGACRLYQQKAVHDINTNTPPELCIKVKTNYLFDPYYKPFKSKIYIDEKNQLLTGRRPVTFASLFAQTKKDGTKDKRYKVNQTTGTTAKTNVQNSPVKADGTPDKRFKANKTAPPIVTPPSHTKADGRPDNAIKITKQHPLNPLYRLLLLHRPLFSIPRLPHLRHPMVVQLISKRTVRQTFLTQRLRKIVRSGDQDHG